jgi:hypothetical protein
LELQFAQWFPLQMSVGWQSQSMNRYRLFNGDSKVAEPHIRHLSQQCAAPLWYRISTKSSRVYPVSSVTSISKLADYLKLM